MMLIQGEFMKFKLSFDPPEPRNQNKPGFRKPVRVLCDDHEIGYFVFSERNVFQIFLYVDFQEKAGWREVLLDQTFSHESECRKWLTENMTVIQMGYKLHHL